MSQMMFATRLPESMCKYIKHKALHTGKQQQELLAEIIAEYQKQDTEFMARFTPLLELSSPEDIGQEDVSHDA